MAGLIIRFTYLPDDGSKAISAYDASQALYGIARSVTIVTNYVVNGRIIKQAPKATNFDVKVEPPRAGSFEFVIPVVGLTVTATDLLGVASAGVLGNFTYDLLKHLYRRATGQREEIKNDKLRGVIASKPGDIDSLADAIDDDVVRFHRPLDAKNIQIFKIYGGNNHFGDFNHATYDYAKTSERGGSEENFEGNVASFNANTRNGRFWVDDEERTIAFNEDRHVKLTNEEKGLLAWSLNEYAHGRDGKLILTGFPLRSRQGSLKRIFVTRVRRS